MNTCRHGKLLATFWDTVDKKYDFANKYRGMVRIEDSLYNLYITNQFQTRFTQEGGGSKIR
jgi:hypothetical protein